MKKLLWILPVCAFAAFALTSVAVEPINSATTTTYTVTTSSTNILTTATSVNFLMLTNDGADDVEVKFATSVSANEGHVLKPNGGITLDTKSSRLNLSVKAVNTTSRVTLTTGIK